MKRIIAAVGLAAVLLVGMTACGQGGKSTELESLTAANSGNEDSGNDTSGNAVLENDVFDSSNVENNTTVILPNGAVSSPTESAYEVESELDGGCSATGEQTATGESHSTELSNESAQPPHAHHYVATIVAPTCTEGGYTEHTCACGESYQDTYTDALGHSFTDEVIPPTTTSQGYTRHTCLRCGYTYDDNFTESLPSRWDTEEAVADLCRRANAYIEAIGCVIDPTAGSWAAPRYTGVAGVDCETCYQAVLAEIETYRAEGKTHLYVYYLPYADAFQIYVAYNLIIS